MKEVPSHLYNIFTHLDILAKLPNDELKDLQFFTADVSALYTNLNVAECINSVMELVEEHWDSLSTYDLTRVEIRSILEVVLENSFFTFNKRLYKQVVGLFMGCRPSPPVAIIRMYRYERSSIFIDTYYISNPVRYLYKRYVDDAGSLARSKEEAVDMLDLIANQDPDRLLKWEVDYPDNPEQFTPFLSTEMRVDETEKSVEH